MSTEAAMGSPISDHHGDRQNQMSCKYGDRDTPKVVGKLWVMDWLGRRRNLHQTEGLPRATSADVAIS